MRKAWLLCCAIGCVPTAQAEPLSFYSAVMRAEDSGPTIAAQDAAVDAAERSIDAAGRLPDPQLVLGAQNVPVEGANRYRFDRDEMTMRSVGVMQDMKNGARLRAEKGLALANAENAQASRSVARLQAGLGAAQAWIGTYYLERRKDAVNQIARNARAFADASRASLSAGGVTIDDTLTAEIDAARLEDRKSDLTATLGAARAELRRWLGDAANEPLADAAPIFAIDAELARSHLVHHPELAAFDAQARVADADLQAARAARYPDWSWELSYGKRDPAFGDMASVEVRIGLPLFQGSRQRPIIDARKADVVRVGADREATLREHLAVLDTRLAQREALIANLKRAQETRLPLSRQRAEAALSGHASGAVTMAQMIAARKDALEAELDVIDLQERLAQIGAYITLEYGELTP